MKYKSREIKLDNSLSFWKAFDNRERFLFFNPLKTELIIGAGRLKTFSRGESLKDCLYAFSSMTFFDSIKDEKWAGFGNETIAFENYFIEKDGRQTIYFTEEPGDIKNVEIKSIRHSFQFAEDDYEDWEQLFNSVHAEILNNNVNKVVISREIKIECDTQINVESILQNLLENNKNSFVFAYFKDGKTFLGASPELLVRKEKDSILSYALAGTILRTEEKDDLQRETLLKDEKNLYEHQIVANTIANTMRKFTDEVAMDRTGILSLRNIHHLHTNVHARDEKSTLLDWVMRLHPTPALGGSPSDKALPLIRRYEKHERGLFAAPIGIMDAKGDGLFVVGIRSALIDKNIAFAYAGCGIVEKSECISEYVETKNKLRTIIESL